MQVVYDRPVGHIVCYVDTRLNLNCVHVVELIIARLKKLLR